ncbi:guanylate kinase [Paenibacillus sp. J31TS4]|uniref:guanylate kinase n=1 Tax=Paenibacillus sp. J31TS4 TaxID=2807195 RepID=UPI001B185DB6|nr:guanylate kinase [Paenibacillus sp. J31TS4]GIP36729.1 guanylate kinase [Paenibacillus sp. J31TS4]
MSNNKWLSNEEDKGILIVLSGPSGVGKGTVCTALRSRARELVYSVSATTRAPREGEVDGLNYFFKTREQFLAMIEQDELLEWAEYVGNYYGTPKEFVKQTLDGGKDVILEIEVQGALKVRDQFPEGIFIFLLPPSLDELENRIVNRGTESDETIRQRMEAALYEINLLEHYDYAIVNDQVEAACNRIEAILLAEHCKRDRFLPKIKKWIEEVSE